MTTVLLVDDHRLVRDGLRRTLTDAGIEVVGEAANGAEGVELAEQLDPDVVLVDVTMPVLDGISATRRLRVRAPRSKVVILTMHAETELMERARKAGAIGYLLKDSSGEEVAKAVERAASGRPVMSAGMGRPTADDVEDDTPEPEIPDLTPREIEILQLLADGKAPADVAAELDIAPKTIRNHLSKAYDKLGVSSRSQAIVVALQAGLIDLG